MRFFILMPFKIARIPKANIIIAKINPAKRFSALLSVIYPNIPKSIKILKKYPTILNIFPCMALTTRAAFDVFIKLTP